MPLAHRSSPPARRKIGSVSITSFSTRPGTATISLTRRTPWWSMPRWTTRSTEDATVGTTKRAEMFSPASSGSVHIFTSASRALLAWSVHMPGSPAFRASRRSRHSSERTSPTMIRLGRIRRLSFTRSRSRTSPVPSRPDCRVWSGTQSGCGNLSSKTSSAEITRSPPGMAAARQFSMVVLPACVAAGDEHVEPGPDRGLEEGGGPGREAAELHQVVQPGGAQHELADVDRGEAAADALEHHVQPMALRQHRVDEGLADVDPPAARLEHPLDQLLHLRRAQHQVGQLVPPVAGHEDPARVVDPDLLDARVVEERLQRPEAGDPGDQLAHDGVDVGRPVPPPRSGCARRGRAPRCRRSAGPPRRRAAGRRLPGAPARARAGRAARPARRARPQPSWPSMTPRPE